MEFPHVCQHALLAIRAKRPASSQSERNSPKINARSVTKSPRVAEQRDVNIHSLTQKDRSPSHWGTNVRAILNATFPFRRIRHKFVDRTTWFPVHRNLQISLHWIFPFGSTSKTKRTDGRCVMLKTFVPNNRCYYYCNYRNITGNVAGTEFSAGYSQGY
ncbi:hypothetical protein TNCV_2315271 [Trichonephila clavipes]|nr:hypothetical protein TNCV_2315271 [Trichonephila clavipes]